ncbi:NS protein [Rhesus macaque parvovirus]|uniref:NS protein n=1 Tax=Rhesus macaque parvovirus TaxID=119756 RepID=Q9J0X7_9VIRU|nr:NS protein [Rhesus macaque parvovirus]AAF61212.1 NS protein [Rhesus macaque parvovirus]
MDMFRGVIQLTANITDFANDSWWCSFLQLDSDDWPELRGVERLVAIFICKVAAVLDNPSGTSLGCKYFLQAEGNHYDAGFHVHIVIGGPFINARNVCNAVETTFNKVLGDLTDPSMSVQFKPAVSKKGEYYRDGFDFVTNYLMPKLYPNVIYSVTNLEEYQYVCNSLCYRKNMHKQHMVSTVDASSSSFMNDMYEPATKRSKSCTVKGEKFRNLVDSLIERNIFSESKWKEVDFNEFARLSASVAGVHQIKTAITLAVSKCNSPDYLFQILTRPSTIHFNIKENRIAQIFLNNNYCPLYAGEVFLFWIQKQLGKRNTVWLYGPPSTGKTNVAMSLASAVPTYGMVNWNNENFPFNDVPYKSLILWDEGLIKSTVVEAAKSILGGQPCRVDQKNKGSVEVTGTPVLITSNSDMTRVVWYTVTLVHQRALKDRMVRFDLTVRCSNALGLIPADEAKQWLWWAQSQPCDAFTQWHQVSEHVAWKADRTGLFHDFSTKPEQESNAKSSGKSNDSFAGSDLANLSWLDVEDTSSSSESDLSGDIAELVSNDNWLQSGCPPTRCSTPVTVVEPKQVSPGTGGGLTKWEKNYSVHQENELAWPMFSVDWVWGSHVKRPVCCVEHDKDLVLPHCNLCLSLEVLPMLIEKSINVPDTLRCSAHGDCTNPFDVLTCKKCRDLSGLMSFLEHDQ